MRPRSIVIEGHDGTGKSTQIELLATYLKEKHGIDSCIISEPNGPRICPAIRSVIVDGTYDRDPITNLLLFTASRHESNLYAKNQLQQGKWILKSRDWSSTVAYQGGGEGISTEFIKQVTEQFTDHDYMHPDFKIILTLSDKIRKERIAKRGILKKPDTFEMRDVAFQSRVNDAYIELAHQENWPIIDASQSVEAIHKEIIRLLREEELI